MRVKGLILTIDGLLALLAVSIAISTIFIYSAKPLEKPTTLMELGRDYLYLSQNYPGIINANEFNLLTGHKVFQKEKDVEDSPLAVKSVYFKYPSICGCSYFPCEISEGNCLNLPETDESDGKHEIMVSVK